MTAHYSLFVCSHQGETVEAFGANPDQLVNGSVRTTLTLSVSPGWGGGSGYPAQHGPNGGLYFRVDSGARPILGRSVFNGAPISLAYYPGSILENFCLDGAGDLIVADPFSNIVRLQPGNPPQAQLLILDLNFYTLPRFSPVIMRRTPNGDLLFLVSFGSEGWYPDKQAILRFAFENGAYSFAGELISSQNGGPNPDSNLLFAADFAVGPGGDIFVLKTSPTGQGFQSLTVVCYDGVSGQYRDVFLSGGAASAAKSILFSPNLRYLYLVSSTISAIYMTGPTAGSVASAFAVDLPMSSEATFVQIVDPRSTRPVRGITYTPPEYPQPHLVRPDGILAHVRFIGDLLTRAPAAIGRLRQAPTLASDNGVGLEAALGIWSELTDDQRNVAIAMGVHELLGLMAGPSREGIQRQLLLSLSEPQRTSLKGLIAAGGGEL